MRTNGPLAPSVAALALVLNALVWGVSWWPFRQLQALGLHPLWATALIYTLCSLLVAWLARGALVELLQTPSLWWLMLASGTTNAAFNWAVTAGDVVRVVLLFYLMPLWAVLLARLLLHERITAAAMLRVAMGLVGAIIVLSMGRDEPSTPKAMSVAMQTWWIDALALVGGFSFALNNVMLRHQAHRGPWARTLAMFGGGALLAGVVAWMLTPTLVMPIPSLTASWLVGATLLGVSFLLGNVALQYGASSLPAQATAVIMLLEVVFASVSAWALGAASLSAPVLLGGALIVGAALLAAVQR